MVFGLGEGKIEIRVEKNAFSFGETIRGTVFLKVNKPKKARGVRTELIAERYVGSGKNRSREIVYSFSANLDVEKEYFGEKEYSFEIKIPAMPVQKMPEGIAQTIAGIASVFGNVSPTRWFLKASLDIPGGLDISKTVQITVS